MFRRTQSSCLIHFATIYASSRTETQLPKIQPKSSCVTQDCMPSGLTAYPISFTNTSGLSRLVLSLRFPVSLQELKFIRARKSEKGCSSTMVWASSLAKQPSLATTYPCIKALRWEAQAKKKANGIRQSAITSSLPAELKS